jgi:hypothetical protein
MSCLFYGLAFFRFCVRFFFSHPLGFFKPLCFSLSLFRLVLLFLVCWKRDEKIMVFKQIHPLFPLRFLQFFFLPGHDQLIHHRSFTYGRAGGF